MGTYIYITNLNQKRKKKEKKKEKEEYIPSTIKKRRVLIQSNSSHIV